jgi:hypothetical protein
MTDPTKYPYSLKFAIATLVLMLLMMLILLNNVLSARSIFAWAIFSVFCIMFIGFSILMIVRRLIPAIKGATALELNATTLIDYVRNVTIDWDDVHAIELTRGRSSATLRISLKWESDYGSQIAIPLRWVKGKDDDIYDMVMVYFEQARSIE